MIIVLIIVLNENKLSEMSDSVAFYYAFVGVGNTPEGNALKQKLLMYWRKISKSKDDLKDPNINPNEIHREILAEFQKAVELLVKTKNVAPLEKALEEAPNIYGQNNFSQTLARFATLCEICDREMYRFLVEYGFRVDVEGMVVSNVRAGKPANILFLEWFFSLYLVGKPDDSAIVMREMTNSGKNKTALVLKALGRVTTQPTNEMMQFLAKYHCAVSGCDNQCFPTCSHHVMFDQSGVLLLHTNDPNICKQPDHLGPCFELCSDHFFNGGYTISEGGEIAKISYELQQKQNKKREAEREISVVEQEIRTHQQQQKIARVVPRVV